MTNFKNSAILFLFILSTSAVYIGCKTSQQPLAPTIIQADILKDTVIVAPVVVPARIETVHVPSTVRDTVYMNSVTKVEREVLDTATLAAFMEEYHGAKSAEMQSLHETVETLQGTINTLQNIIIVKTHKADSVKSKLDTTKQQVRAAQAVIDPSVNVIFDFAPFAFFTLVAIIFCAWATNWFSTRRLKGKFPFPSHSHTDRGFST